MPEQHQEQFPHSDDGYYVPGKGTEWGCYLVGGAIMFASSGWLDLEKNDGPRQAIIDVNPGIAAFGLAIIAIGRLVRRNY